MIRFFLRRICESIPVFFAIITATFFMARFVPGGPFDKEKSVPPETLEALNAYYGLNEPLGSQYLKFLKNLACGELGPSYKYSGWSVNELIAEKAKVSLELGFYALIFALAFGLLLGVLAAVLKDKPSGKIIGAISLAGICLPSMVLAPVAILLFAIKLKCFNAMGWNFPSDAVLPSITLGLFYLAWIARLARASAIGELSKGYVKTARAKGLGAFKIYFVHVLRNAIQPVVSYLGPAAAGLLTGSFVVETIFQIPGLGKFFISSALDNDYTMVMGCVILYAGFIIIFNLISDLVLAALNPKIAKGFFEK
ncbi:ABC transporter permease [Intestinicryptomonas porci]|uniref:ABC transporter permease n=1 Tax=Intestinicryptomonas porci TaxID=2926320 RepID=A0ABU4WER3_9BACT|nr:ABC transporter permease [Opitutales bacterium CLA-KB-P66]